MRTAIIIGLLVIGLSLKGTKLLRIFLNSKHLSLLKAALLENIKTFVTDFSAMLRFRKDSDYTANTRNLVRGLKQHILSQIDFIVREINLVNVDRNNIKGYSGHMHDLQECIERMQELKP